MLPPTPTPQIYSRLELNLPNQRHWMDNDPPRVKTPSEWFATKFPDAAERYGCPFLEIRQSSCDGFTKISPAALNYDFFAGMLSGDPKLGHSVVYNEADLTFYYREPIQMVFKPTTPEKLQNYYRAMMLRCAQELDGEIDKVNLFAEFRSERNARTVTSRAKSVLACSPEFFSATSPHQRIQGPELHERVARVLVETMLQPREGACLTVTQAYDVFCRLSQQRNLGVLKRSLFRELMRDLVKAQYGMALRNDVPDEQNRHQQAWKGLAVVEPEPLAA